MFTCYKCKSIVAIGHMRDITYRSVWNYSSVYLINYSWHSKTLLSKLCVLMKPMEILKVKAFGGTYWMRLQDR